MPTIYRNHTTRQLEWPPEYKDATLVAESRTGQTQVFRLADGRLIEVAHFKSGNADARTVRGIADYLTIRYQDRRSNT